METGRAEIGMVAVIVEVSDVGRRVAAGEWIDRNAKLRRALSSSEDFGDEPEGVVGILVVTAMLPFRQLYLRARQLFVGDFAQDVSKGIEARPPLVVGVDDVPRRP